MELLGLDVTVYGLRRGRLLDPFDITVEASDPPADATANCVFFGSWSSRRNLLSLDAGDDRVHLSGRNSVAP